MPFSGFPSPCLIFEEIVIYGCATSDTASSKLVLSDEAASKVVQQEEAVKQQLCHDLNKLVQESSNTQYSRLEELKRRLEALNPGRPSSATIMISCWMHQKITTAKKTVFQLVLEGGTGFLPALQSKVRSPKDYYCRPCWSLCRGSKY